MSQENGENKAAFQSEFGLDIEEMTKAGLHLGHRASKTHPKMKPFIYGMKNTIHIIDLEKARVKFEEALKFIRDLASQGKTILLVGTKIQCRDIISNMGQELSLPYVQERWLGGTFTNLAEIKKRIDYFKELKALKEKGEFSKFSKKERIKKEQELAKLEQKFKGLEHFKELPFAVFVCDMQDNELVLREAKRTGVKIIAIAHTNVDPDMADYIIPANDDAITSVKYILGKVKQAIEEGRKQKIIDRR